MSLATRFERNIALLVSAATVVLGVAILKTRMPAVANERPLLERTAA